MPPFFNIHAYRFVDNMNQFASNQTLKRAFLIKLFVPKRTITNFNACSQVVAKDTLFNKKNRDRIISSNYTHENIKNNINTSKSTNKGFMSIRTFKTFSGSPGYGDQTAPSTEPVPGSVAFAECETAAITDLFYQFARNVCENGDVDEEHYLNLEDVRKLLNSIGERPDEKTLIQLFKAADTKKDGRLSLSEFLVASDSVLGGAPARIVIVVGGPGSGKGILCQRLVQECGVVHLSSGDLLRHEVESGTPLGKEVAEIMKRGGLVSSAVITALIRRHTRNFPGKRILLDGFPRSVENAHDFLEDMGTPELALHLDCDDTILMERIIKRGKEGEKNGIAREDDNFETALQRLRTYHKYHKPTMDWLREQHGKCRQDNMLHDA